MQFDLACVYVNIEAGNVQNKFELKFIHQKIFEHMNTASFLCFVCAGGEQKEAEKR